MPSAQRHTQVFIIDDDPYFCTLCAGQLAERDIQAASFSCLADAFSSRQADPAAIILDWQLGTIDSVSELPGIRARFPHAPVVLTTSAPAVNLVVRAIKAGAFDFIPKPLVDEARLFATVSKAIAHGRLLSRAEAMSTALADGEMLGESAPMRSVLETIRMAAPTDATLLILGETGTGKELAARAAHSLSGRRGALVCVNMAALPRELVESTLFGHERGSFTGADNRRKGLCEQASEGTLFFDEIGEMPMDLQAKLLRFLQERTVRRVGGTEEIRVDARIIAATNRDLTEEVRDGRFREDLFHRLNTIPLELPPLRERGQDVVLLAFAVLREMAAKYAREFESISPEAIDLLAAYSWPGNIRELRQTIERIVVLNDARELIPSMLPEGLKRGRTLSPKADRPSLVADQSAEPILTLEEMEREMIRRAMARTNGSAREAAKLLGVSLATLYRRLNG